MENNRTMQPNGAVFMFGMLLGAAIGALASAPKSREWLNKKSEWARTDGKQTLDQVRNHAKEGMTAMKEHTREGMAAMKDSAKAVKEDVSTLKPKAKDDITDENE
jgi:gas vesicle protein